MLLTQSTHIIDNGNMNLQEQLNRIQEMMGIKEDSTSKIVEDIKNMLLEDYGEDSWEEYVDRQEIGECQTIVSFITRSFPEVEKVFGEIEVDEPYIDEYGDEQTLMTHHWVEINGEPYDFSKGTLKDYIDWSDMYDPKVDEPERYHGF